MEEKGQPDIAPEASIGLLPAIVQKGLDNGKLVKAAQVFTDGGMKNGWWIPKYLADAHPEIKTVDDALKHPELFPAPEDSKMGAIFNGPQGWGWTVITAQLYKAFDAQKVGFVLVDTGSQAGLDGSVAKAFSRHQGWLGYYWSPTALLGKYPMVRLNAGVPYNAAEWKRCITVASCPDPKETGWPDAELAVTLLSSSFAKRANPEVIKYLNTRSWSNATVNELLAWMTSHQATGEDGARYFLKTQQAIWSKWVPASAVQKIQNAVE